MARLEASLMTVYSYLSRHLEPYTDSALGTMLQGGHAPSVLRVAHFNTSLLTLQLVAYLGDQSPALRVGILQCLTTDNNGT